MLSPINPASLLLQTKQRAPWKATNKINVLLIVSVLWWTPPLLSETLPKTPPSRAQQVAVYFHRPLNSVVDLRQQGFGYGEMVKILVIAQLSKQPIPKLLERHQQGVGWGTLSREFGLSPLKVKKEVDKARQALHIRTRRS